MSLSVPLCLPHLPFFVARNHPRFAELTEVTDLFFLETWPFESQHERDFFVRCDYGSFVSKLIPDGESEKMIWACRAGTLLFLTDDWIDKKPHGKGVGLSGVLIARLFQHGTDGHAFTSTSTVKDYLRERIADSEARLRDVIGNAWWSQHTERYNIPGKPVPPRIIHLEGKGDIIVPEPQGVI
ncbi:hypothetical protein FB451DRAFT_1194858 [Mycena latifolia]|nr:hypothetical protein FB451DRAFT_1194858 [Mycena latifolia]